MRKFVSVFLAAGCLAGAAVYAPVNAADHRDGPGVSADPATDINDVYAWMSPDASKVWLAMTVFPGADANAKFSDKALYVFRVSRFKMFGDAAPTTTNIICRFAADQKISCWAPSGEYITGDASATAGISTASGKMKVFAGLRDDPFFFNIAGFRNALTTTKGALMMDPKACPKAAEPIAPTAITALLSKDATMMGPGKDGFAKGGDAVPNYSGNVLSIVISIDTALLTEADRKLLGVWASTNMAQ